MLWIPADWPRQVAAFQAATLHGAPAPLVNAQVTATPAAVEKGGELPGEGEREEASVVEEAATAVVVEKHAGGGGGKEESGAAVEPGSGALEAAEHAAAAVVGEAV